MFNLEEFKNSLILEKVGKLNKFLSKNKFDKVSKLLEEFQSLLDQQEYLIPITYILSILAEKNINLIPKPIIQKIEPFLESQNVKLKINTLIIFGFAMLTNSDYIDRYFRVFVKFLLDNSTDIRNNIHYFLLELIESNPSLVKSNIDIFLDSIEIENNKDNILALLICLNYCVDLDFDHLYKFRSIAKRLINSFEIEKQNEIFVELIKLINKFFLQTNKLDTEDFEPKRVRELLENHFLMRKYNFTERSKNTDLRLKDYLKEFTKSNIKDKKLFFYARTKENTIYIYELEKSKLISFFERETKISDEKIHTRFSAIIENNSELKIFIKTLIKLKIINGYYSDIGFFYPYSYLKYKFMEDLQIGGTIKIKSFNFLPYKFIKNIINDISKSTNQNFLRFKDQETYISLKKVYTNINSEAAKKSVIDLKSYREILLDEDFIKLMKNMPREFLSEFHKGTQWLTNLGIQKINNEVQNSKVLGYFDISKISDKLDIKELLLLDVFDQFVDNRSGIWNNSRNIFYYSKYLNDRINEISAISEEDKKLKLIQKISQELNIDKNHILSKLDENLNLIAEEIKKKDLIKISEYLEKTGMELDVFLKFIDELGISYFKKADQLIFAPQKIEDAKNDIKFILIDKSKSNDTISLGTYDITSSIIKDLIQDLVADGKLKGIFHENEGEVLFYTERGIRKLMLDNSLLFSFNDLFYGKELEQAEIGLLREIFDDLMKTKRIKGTFDEETLTFSSEDVIFAKDYNSVLFEFEKMVGNYLNKFEIEFQKIKKILTKKGETIFPQEIKIVQEIIDKINEKYVNWRSGVEAFIRKTDKKLLREQRVNLKQYKDIFSRESKEEIKLLADDPEVIELLNNFKTFIRLFNKLEVKYPNILFYQKRLINNPDDKESEIKLDELLNELELT
ncbi:MAG: hypothetical protein JSV62_13580 [Promethearchaeota archaeon]|nr:MAG: hypothetical protein JSV62_13580 [Candidatus Lokiarchaeota archaeon]